MRGLLRRRAPMVAPNFVDDPRLFGFLPESSDPPKILLTGTNFEEITNVPESTVSSAVHFTIDWIQARLRERTSWDGFTIIVISLMVLIASPLVRYAAWGGLIYGAWTLWRKEKVNPLGGKSPESAKGPR
jgi:hypothetical protein